jgi:FtsZ-binding cell division protein ZapB
MGPLELIEKLINEHGSAAVLREHLGLLKAQHAALQAERDDAKAQCLQLQARVEQYKRQADAAQQELEALRHGALTAMVCAQCASPELTRTGTRPHPTFGRVGINEAVYRCRRCGTDSFFEIPTP